MIPCYRVRLSSLNCLFFNIFSFRIDVFPKKISICLILTMPWPMTVLTVSVWYSISTFKYRSRYLCRLAWTEYTCWWWISTNVMRIQLPGKLPCRTRTFTYRTTSPAVKLITHIDDDIKKLRFYQFNSTTFNPVLGNFTHVSPFVSHFRKDGKIPMENTFITRKLPVIGWIREA